MRSRRPISAMRLRSGARCWLRRTPAISLSGLRIALEAIKQQMDGEFIVRKLKSSLNLPC